MNLYQLLTHIPHERLQRIAEAFGVGAYSPSKRNLLQSIGARYRDTGFLSDLAGDLPYECRGFLRSLTLFAPPDAEEFELSEEAVSLWFSYDERFEKIEDIAACGLLFPNDIRRNGQVILPHELRSSLREAFLAQFKPLEPAPATAGGLLSKRNALVESVFHLLCVLLHTKIKQTQGGGIHKKLFEKWSERTGFAQAETRFNTALAFCRRNGLIEEEGGTVRLTDEAPRWLSKPEAELRRDVWRFLLNGFVFTDRLLQKTIALLAAAGAHHETPSLHQIDDLLGELELNAWTEESALVEREKLVKRLLILDAAGVAAVDSLESPSAAGLSEWGRQLIFAEAETAPETAHDEGPVVIQPNFDMLAPPDAGYETLWRLDQLAEFRRRDVMTEYHLSQESLLRAMRRGWSAQAIEEFLTSKAGGRLPDLVAFSVEEWCAKFGRIQFERVVLVECDQPGLADEIVHLPEAGALLDRRVSPTAFAVTPGEARTLFRLLRDKGYEPSSKNAFSDSD